MLQMKDDSYKIKFFEASLKLTTSPSQDFSCCAVLDIVAQVKNTQKLVAELRWPDKTFSEHLQSRTQKTTAEIFDCFVSKVYGVLLTYPRLQVFSWRPFDLQVFQMILIVSLTRLEYVL